MAAGARWIRHDASASDADGYEWLLASGADDDAEWDVPVDAPLLAMYTAAFDGTANAALLSHQALIVQNLVIGRVQDISDETVFLNSGPLFHIATFMSTNATLHHGGRNVFVRRLRDKIDKRASRHTFIQTRYGVGYKLEAVPKDRAAAGVHRL